MIKGTKTEQNLLKAFAGESQARNRYTFFASKAKKDGFEQIAAIFTETAANEQEHANLFFAKLEGGVAEITATYPTGIVKSTLENLEAAYNGENEETNVLYPAFAKTAREEGFEDVARLFEIIATIEANHERRYRALHENIINNKVFSRDSEVEWICRECGYVYKGTSAPTVCPSCAHPQAFYQLNVINY